jgi:hypothetical protein
MQLKTGVLFPGVKRPGRGTIHLIASSSKHTNGRTYTSYPPYLHIYSHNRFPVARDSVVGIATTLSRAGRSGDRVLVGPMFCVLLQTGREDHAAFCTMGTRLFPAVKRPGRGVQHLPPSTAEVKDRVELYIYSPSGLSWPFLG